MLRGILLEYMLDKIGLVNVYLNNHLQSYYILLTVKCGGQSRLRECAFLSCTHTF